MRSFIQIERTLKTHFLRSVVQRREVSVRQNRSHSRRSFSLQIENQFIDKSIAQYFDALVMFFLLQYLY